VALAHGSHRGTSWLCRLTAVTFAAREVVGLIVVVILHSCQVGRTGETYKGGNLGAAVRLVGLEKCTKEEL
jgi:hypothetical protein